MKLKCARYQSDAVATEYATLGYLVGIMSILGFPIMPRAKFLQNIILNVIAACFSAAVAMLAMWSSVQARIHTQARVRPGAGGPGTVGTPSAGAQTGGYNSSQSVVCAIWLFFQVYVINSLRSKFPQFVFPAVIWSIFTIVSMSYGPNFTTTTQAVNFAQRLLLAFLTGFGIAFGVSLVIFPMTSRKVVFKVIPAYVGTLRGAMKAYVKYVESLEHSDMFAPTAFPHAPKSSPKAKAKACTNQAMAFKKAIEALTALNTKLHAELPFAKREFALGKLGPDDLNELFRLLRQIMIPLMGLSSVADVFERTSHHFGWDHVPNAGDEQTAEKANPMKEKSVHSWNQLAKLMHEPVVQLTQIMEGGLDHAMLNLQFVKTRKKSKPAKALSDPDVEAKGDAIEPGDPMFGEYMDLKIQEFEKAKQPMLRKWCELQGIDLAPDFFEKPTDSQLPWSTGETGFDQRRRRRQMYLLLYIDLLLVSTARATLDLVYFADIKARSGKMDRKHLIAPGYKRFRKWLRSLLNPNEEDSSDDATHAMNESSGTGSTVAVGAAYQKRKDPEHLPPQNFSQKVGDVIRLMPSALASSHSSFGFRVACATISIAILGFLGSTHVWYTTQRGFWAVIMIR